MHSNEPLERRPFDSKLRYQRQSRLPSIGESGQAKIAQSRVAIVGVGALGSMIAERLARSGVGFIRLIDRDWVELDNLPRQTLFTESDVEQRLPKSMAAALHLQAINSSSRFESIVEDVSYRNAHKHLADVDVILDGTDNFETRFLINDLSLEKNIPWIHGGCVGSTGQVMVIIPGKTACFRCLVPDLPPPGSSETCDTAGVLGPAVAVIGAWQAAETIKWICGVDSAIDQCLLCFDLWHSEVRKIRLDPGRMSGQCRACQGHRDFLSGVHSSTITSLCGRDAIQIQPAGSQILDLNSIRQKLIRFGAIHPNPFFVRSEGDQYTLTVFRDGRIVVTGTQDESIARSLVAQWIGN